MKKDCFSCHGKWYTQPLSCGHSFCPIYTKLPQMKTIRLDKDNFQGTAPSVFVGRYGYPNLNVGILSPPEKIERDGELYDAPREWSQRGFQIQDVLDFRSVLINSRTQVSVKQPHKYVEISQEVAMASKPVDVEFFLQKKPVYQVKTSDVETVMGAYAELKKAVLVSNPKINQHVEKAFSDSDLKVADALKILYKKGIDETALTRMLSVGSLGVKVQRKLVPTRWSITATDDTLGKSLLEEIKDYKETDYRLFFGGYLGNYFMILFFPRVWSYELFEMYMPSTLLNPDKEMRFTTDHEFYDGRKTYVSETAGGYYACRIGILEKLQAIKRQSSVVVLRFITDEYMTPLGVWVVREATRKALAHGREFASEREMMQYVKHFILTQFNFDVSSVLKKSKVLEHIHSQRTLFDFGSK